MIKKLLSVVIITYNEAKQIETCLRHVDFADEWIVVDSGSTDGTQEIVKQFGARCIHQKWLGYGAQKQIAVLQAQHDWVLCLDADEIVTPELKKNIINLLGSIHCDAYFLERKNYFLGKGLSHGEGYPDLVLRLFNKKQASWSQDNVHEKVIVSGSIGRIKGELQHFSEINLESYLEKQNKYTSLQAANSLKTPKLSTLFFRPVFRFFKYYFFKKGFLDGIPGFIHCVISCFNCFLKYAKAYEKNKSKHI
jgi:glycosyltransferase involved in cell wall biosynthesis